MNTLAQYIERESKHIMQYKAAKKRYIAATWTAIFACIVTCRAEPLYYSESIDFSDSQDAPTVIGTPLGIGTNTITGSASPAFLSLEQDKDFFSVRIPSGSILTEMIVTISDYGPEGSDLGAFSLIPTTQGKLEVVADGTFPLPFSLDNQRKVNFLAESPVDIDTFSFGSFNYTVSLIIEKDLPALTLHNLGTLSWNAVTGKVYQVQWTEQLTSNSWNNLGGAITASTDTITIYDDIASVDQRFYRIVPPDAAP